MLRLANYPQWPNRYPDTDPQTEWLLRKAGAIWVWGQKPIFEPETRLCRLHISEAISSSSITISACSMSDPPTDVLRLLTASSDLRGLELLSLYTILGFNRHRVISWCFLARLDCYMSDSLIVKYLTGSAYPHIPGCASDVVVFAQSPGVSNHSVLPLTSCHFRSSPWSAADTRASRK
jgi:hypothetical protein